jgi:hypothetical protein
MSSRERRRAERRKRKQRSAERPPAEPAPAGENGSGEPDIEDLAAEAEAKAAPSRRELRDQEAREALEPLEEGERPLVVTIGAVLSALIGLSIVGAWAVGAEAPTADGGSERPTVLQVFPPSILFAVMAYGMWMRRYWAVLGFQAIMAIIMVGAFIALIGATSVVRALIAAFALSAAGTLFWFTVKALARIQMPSREGLD